MISSQDAVVDSLIVKELEELSFVTFDFFALRLLFSLYEQFKPRQSVDAFRLMFFQFHYWRQEMAITVLYYFMELV